MRLNVRHNRRPLSRRAVLRGAGGVTVALPFLEAMEARAQPAYPKRFIGFFSPNGINRTGWDPVGTETNFMLPSILAPLEPHKSKIIVLRGVDNKVARKRLGDDAHTIGGLTLWTGAVAIWKDGATTGSPQWGGGISIDQEMGQKLGGATRFRTLELGVKAIPESRFWPGYGARSWLGPKQNVVVEDDPAKMFSRLFSDGVPSASGGPDPAVAARLLERKNVLDLVLERFGKLNARLGAEDRQRLDQHATSIRGIQRSLDQLKAAPAGAACSKPALQGLPPSSSSRTPAYEVNDAAPAVLKAQMDLLVSAFACDLTRFATLSYSQPTGDISHTWLGASGDHHSTYSHAGDSDAAKQDGMIKITRWICEQFAYLVGRLKSIPEGNGTMLDNTVIVWGMDVSKGNQHLQTSMPFVLAGSGGGYFKTGRSLTYQNASHNDLLVSVLNAVGVPATTFGTPEFCTGPLPGLT